MFRLTTAILAGCAAAFAGPAAASTLIGTGVGSTWFPPGGVAIDLPGSGTYDISVSADRDVQFVLNGSYYQFWKLYYQSPPGPPNTYWDFNENYVPSVQFSTSSAHMFTFVVPNTEIIPFTAYGYGYFGVPDGTPAYRKNTYDLARVMVDAFLVADDPVSFSVTVTRRDDLPPAPAPEPATWALMIIGFGTVGTWVRRARRPLAAA